ncbi:mitochondrial 54S ribosomal protein bL21m [Lodderomyces beijingensis]|uniref:Large ribosomal subunit protein bL21m n=1 Tax=Lodderomyces beijingensis TaxID=1775926 RepID=A0ABP0ZUU3_9ASCO
MLRSAFKSVKPVRCMRVSLPVKSYSGGAAAGPSSIVNASTTYPTSVPGSANGLSQQQSISALKLSSNASRDLYAVFKLHNLPYLVTKGDKVYLPFKLKNVQVGDVLDLSEVTTLGTSTHTLTMPSGIDRSLFDIKASVVEITREPLYQVTRTKQRCRRIKTFNVEPFQTVLVISELKLR